MAIRITPTSAKIDISIDTSIVASLALIRQAEVFASGEFTTEFALKNLKEILVALKDLGWNSETVNEFIAKVEAE